MYTQKVIKFNIARRVSVISTFTVILLVRTASSAAVKGGDSGAGDPYSLFETPGKMVRVSKGASLSLYCSGRGSPTIVLETGLGGQAFADWYKLQPLLSNHQRTCSYDRAGYGFSELGQDLPRDLTHDVRDLHELLSRSGEQPPFILVGHSNGGLIIGAYADLYPTEVKALVFLDAAIALKKYPIEPAVGPDATHPNKYFEEQLRQTAECETYAAKQETRQLTGTDTPCIPAFHELSPRMAAVERSNEHKPSYWAALLSELRCNYEGTISGQAMALLPHHWTNIPIRVFAAAVPDVDDTEAARLFGIPATDKAALIEARASRHRWEALQAQVCQFSRDCRVTKIPTTMHEVQNANPELVASVVRQLR